MSFNFAKFMSAVTIGVPAIGQIVAELHPENTAEGVKIAAGVELFKILVEGVHAIATAGDAAAPVPAATAVAVSAAPVIVPPNA